MPPLVTALPTAAKEKISLVNYNTKMEDVK